ncbi:MAG: glycine zipper 2TM domain-containing protein [Halioglobus sp.]
MNKSMLIGTVFGAGLATAIGGVAGYRMLSGPEFAQVVAVTPVTETVRTPREECSDKVVTRQKPVQDTHKITGTVIGAVAGGLLGDAIGGGGKNTAAKIAGAAAGGFAGNKTQEHLQKGDTYQTTERVCNTVFDESEKTIGYNVKYTIGDTAGEVRMDHDPGDTIPLQDGKLVLTRASGSVDRSGG